MHVLVLGTSEISTPESLLSKKLLVGRFRSGAWDFWDVRSMEWTRQFFGNQLSYINAFEWTLSKALAGSQWRMVLYRFSGMRVGKRVFVDRDVELMGALKRMLISSIRTC